MPLTDTYEKMALYVPSKLHLRILLRNTLIEKRISQKELADMPGVKIPMVNQMVNGKENL